MWRRLTGKYEFDLREEAVLEAACAQVDNIVELDKALVKAGVVVLGSQGQPRLNPVVTELRQARIALTRLLGDLQLPSDDELRAKTWRQLQAKRAADSRWTEKRRLDERRARIMAKELDGEATGA